MYWVLLQKTKILRSKRSTRLKKRDVTTVTLSRLRWGPYGRLWKKLYFFIFFIYTRSEWLSPIPQFLQFFPCVCLSIYLFVCASVPLWRTVEFYLRWKSVWQVTFVRQSPCTPHFLPPPLNTTYELVLHIVQYNSRSLKKCVYNKNSYSQLSKWNDHWN